MTISIPIHGGGAQPVSSDTSGKTIGRVALRAYGFPSEAAAIAEGYRSEAGPAMSVYVVSAAQLASGAFVLDGDPKALPVYAAPAGMKVEGGYSQPIYVAGGSLGSSPIVYNYILDRFIGADGTLLSAHPLETGEAWTARINDLYISGNKAIPFGSGFPDGGKVSRDSVPLPIAWIDNFTVEAMFTPEVISDYERGFCVRYQDENNHWKIRTVASGGNGLRIIEVNGGVETLRAFDNPIFSNGTPYKFRVSVIGNVITATWDTTTITYTSSFLAGEDTVALFTTFEMNHTESIDDFLIWQGSGAPPPNPLYP